MAIVLSGSKKRKHLGKFMQKHSKVIKLKPVIKRYLVDGQDILDAIDKTHVTSRLVTENLDLVKSIDYTSYLMRLSIAHTKAAEYEKDNGWGRDYPKNPMIDEKFTLSVEEEKVLLCMRDKKPFKVSSNKEYLDIIQECFIGLAKAQNSLPPTVLHSGD